MQDFTEQLSINNKPLTQAKSDKWLNKDRLWNFVFWFGMSGGFSLAFAVSGINKVPEKFSYWSTFIFWLTIFGVPLFVRYFSKTTFVKNMVFLTSENKEFDITKSLPNSFFTVVTTIVLTSFTGIILDNKLLYVSDTIGIFFVVTVFFGVPSLFFIFKNCPISILFNRKFWIVEFHLGFKTSSSNSHYGSSFSSSSRSSSIDYITNPAYGGLDSNIYNKYR